MSAALYYILSVWYVSTDGVTSFTQRYADYETCVDVMFAVGEQFDRELKAKELRLKCEPVDAYQDGWVWAPET